MAVSALVFSLASTQANTSWADTSKSFRELALECGPVFSFASETFRESFSQRLTYSTRKESVLKEYLWVQRRALTYKAVSEAASGKKFPASTPVTEQGLYDNCFAEFTKPGAEQQWASVVDKVNINDVDQALEDMIEPQLSFGYKRVVRASRLLRDELPFQIGDEFTASRLVFDPPNLVVFATAPLVEGRERVDAAPILCNALTKHKVDRALYPLIRLRIVVSDNNPLATASGGQCQ